MSPTPRDIQLQAAEYIPRIRGYFTSKALSPEDVEDLTQDVLLSAIESFSRFKWKSSVATWVYAICRNVYRTHAYRLSKIRSISQSIVDSHDQREEEAVDVRVVIDKLPQAYQHVYVLYYERGLSVRETSERLSRPEGTVKYLLSELRRRFRTEWQ